MNQKLFAFTILLVITTSLFANNENHGPFTDVTKIKKFKLLELKRTTIRDLDDYEPKCSFHPPDQKNFQFDLTKNKMGGI